MGGYVADSDRGSHRGNGGQFPGPIHFPLHPRNLLHPHLSHLHLRDLQ